MKVAFYFFLVLTFSANAILGQKQGNIWYFGSGVGLDFNTSPPSLLSNGLYLPNVNYSPKEGSATISDSSGNLLFYTNGEYISNANHTTMFNGDSLMGLHSSTHGAFIIPQPLSNSIFYVFTTDGLERDLSNGLRYSVVDMCLDGGLGGVISGKKNLLLLDTVCEKLTAVKHQNGKDIWLITHKYHSQAFYAYQLSENGIIDTVISNIGSIHTGSNAASAIGQIKASPNGQKIALVASNRIPSIAELFDFDQATGLITNPISLSTSFLEYGVAFSPDNTKLYITNHDGLNQFDLLAGGGTATAINSSKITITMSGICNVAGLQLGPNGKIYMSRCLFPFDTTIAVINNPNGLGTACNFVDHAIRFSASTGSGFPSFIADYSYNNQTVQCLINTSSLTAPTKECRVFPNPFSHSTTLEYSNPNKEPYSILIYNLQGQVIQTISQVRKSQVEIERGNLAAGLYFFQIQDNRKILFTGKMQIL